MNKAERQLNLVFILLNEKRGLTRQKIRSLVADYRDATSDQSFERMFERDKDDLKQLGFSISTFQDSFASSEEIYYTLLFENLFISDDNFTTDEKLLMQMALMILQKSNQSDIAVERKMETIFNVNGLKMEMESPSINMESLELILECINDKTRCSFFYPLLLENELGFFKRDVTPLHMVIRNRKYYLVSFCHDRRDYRVFRVDKIQNLVKGSQIDDTEYVTNKVNDLIDLLNETDALHEAKILLKEGQSLGLVDLTLTNCTYDDNRIEFTFRESLTEDVIRFLASNLNSLDSIQPDWLQKELVTFLQQGNL
jgi:predicted DNA-binding transcriptional regulator YafY